MEKSTRQSNLCEESTKNLQEEIHVAFAIDLLYFLAKSNGLRWQPKGQVIYEINQISPLTNGIKEAVSICLQNTDKVYKDLYKNLTFCDPQSKYRCLGAYVERCSLNFRKQIENCTPYSAFTLVVHIAALSMVFYRERLYHAPDQVVIAISKVLSDAACMFDIDLYILFSVNALGIKLRNDGRQTEILRPK